MVFASTLPVTVESDIDRPVNLADMQRVKDALRCEPILSLAASLQQLGLIDGETLQELKDEDADLLRSKSEELVKRQLTTLEGLHHALARTAGIVEIDAAKFQLPAGLPEAIPLRTLRAQDLLVLGEIDGLMVVASWCPTSDEVHSHLCALTGRNIMMVWADRDSIAKRVEELDSHAPPLPAHALAHPTASAVEILSKAHIFPARLGPAEHQDIATIMAEAVHEIASGKEPEETLEANQSSTMVRMVKRMIMDAQSTHASDIHIETNPGEEFTRIRMRRDGDLELYQKLPPQLRAAMVSRIKVMARLDISERRRPQDGKINFADFGGEHLELRVAIMPTHDNMEDVVMRLLSSSKPTPLASLGLQPRDTEVVARMSGRSFGLILAVGPTGSGKTTTLHSLLAAINTDEKKIWTAEDPIEITQPGLRQVQINPKIGLTFASAMRGFLRSDPDVIMIGEIRDEETAKIAIEASLTGHLVLSTLHTNSASESVVRLLDLGMDAMNFADSLVGIVAQRLVRALCVHCSVEKELSLEEWTELVREYIHASPLTLDQGSERLLLAAGFRHRSEVRIKSPRGCAHCSAKGYKGRMGVYEILENNADLRLLIQKRSRPSEIFNEAVQSGMRSLRHDALEKAVAGLIDLRQARAAYL